MTTTDPRAEVVALKYRVDESEKRVGELWDAANAPYDLSNKWKTLGADEQAAIVDLVRHIQDHALRVATKAIIEEFGAPNE